MIIGIDGGPLSIQDNRLKAGVWRVASNLIKEFSANTVKDLYRLYMFKRGGDCRKKTLGGKVQCIFLPQIGFRKVWQPMHIMTHPIQAYIGLAQTFPPLPCILCDVMKIGIIYDTGFLDYPHFYSSSVSNLMQNTARLASVSDRIITISEASKNAIVNAYGISPERIDVAYLGVDDIFRKPIPAYTHTRPYFLFVGALKAGKNVPAMIRAFAEVLKNSRRLYDFFLVGSDYWLDPEIENTIRALKLSARVHKVGFVADDVLASYYRGARALLSVSLIEGFGLPVAEAMASGCPVIASTIGSYPEVVGNAGLLVDPHDSSAITQAMLRLEKNASFRNNCIHTGRTLSEKYRWNYFAGIVRNSIH